MSSAGAGSGAAFWAFLGRPFFLRICRFNGRFGLAAMIYRKAMQKRLQFDATTLYVDFDFHLSLSFLVCLCKQPTQAVMQRFLGFFFKLPLPVVDDDVFRPVERHELGRRDVLPVVPSPFQR